MISERSFSVLIKLTAACEKYWRVCISGIVTRGKAEEMLKKVKKKEMKEEEEKREGNLSTSHIALFIGLASVIYVCSVYLHEYNSLLEIKIKFLCQPFLFSVEYFTDSEFCGQFKAVLC